jgi:hypothetical protein
MKQNFLKPKKLKNRIQPKKSKTKFDCRVINDPIELMKLGYTPSKKVSPINDNELLKMIA